MATLVLLRHGESVWNKKNIFTGWTDVDLSDRGVEEAHEAAQKLKQAGFKFDVAYTSVLVRATRTLDIVLDDLGQKDIPVFKDKAINERMYGDLQGKNKDEMRKKVGAEQVHLWRRSYNVAPPNGESLEDTCKRAIPYFREYIEKDLKQGKTVLVCAHGNSLRGIVKYLENISDKDIPNLNIPTGIPYVYEVGFEDGKIRILKKEILN